MRELKTLIDARAQIEADAIALAMLVAHDRGKVEERIRLANRIIGAHVAISSISRETSKIEEVKNSGGFLRKRKRDLDDV